MFVSPKRNFRSFGTSKTTPLMADLSSSGSAPKHTNPLTMFSLWLKYKLPQIFSQREENYPEELSQREKYYPEKCHNNPASLYRPPSKLLFQGSFDKVMVIFNFILLIGSLLHNVFTVQVQWLVRN